MPQTKHNVDRSTNQLGLPPPGALELTDSGRVVGWVMNNKIGFRGFAGEQEAAHAAWVAYRTLARRLARRMGTRPVPIDVEPLAIHRRGEREVIVASGRDVARLARFASDTPGGADTFGFEITVPGELDELGVRAKAYAIYRTIRKSGIAWEMWRPRREPPKSRLRLVTASPTSVATPSALDFVARYILGSVALILAIALLAVAPRTVTGPLAFVVIAGLIASGSIVLADRWKEQRRGKVVGIRDAGAEAAEASRR